MYVVGEGTVILLNIRIAQVELLCMGCALKEHPMWHPSRKRLTKWV